LFHLGNRTLRDVQTTLARYEALIADRRVRGLDPYFVPDRSLGWRLQPFAHHPRWPYATNRFGNRRSWPDGFGPIQPDRHVAILGNSHAHGDEAPDDETWIYQTQEKLGPGWRLHNLGVTAYATDQAILRFLDFLEQQRVDIAVLAVTTTELYRNLNQCRAFVLADREIPLFKPRFRQDRGELRLIDIPTKGARALASELDDPAVLAALRRDDAFYPGLMTQAIDIGRRLHLPLPTIYERLYEPALELTIALCRYFLQICQARGITPIIMFLPVFWGGFPAGTEYDTLAHTFSGDVPLIDARRVFSPERLKLSRDVLHQRANHYTRLSAGWVAEYAAAQLEEIAGAPALSQVPLPRTS
jgi:hypothetical protein